LQIDGFIAQFSQIINAPEYVARGSAKGYYVGCQDEVTMVVVKKV